MVGAGILGLASARRLAQLHPDATVTVFEKEPEIAAHQTGRSSGVVHAGIYYAPGSLKASLCRRGVGLLRAYCEERALPYVECGKLVVAVDDGEVARLRELERRGQANGVPGRALARLGAGTGGRAARRGGRGSPLAEHRDHGLPGRGAGVRRGCRGRRRRDPVGSRGRPASASRADGYASPPAGRSSSSTGSCSAPACSRTGSPALAGDDPGPTIVPFRGEYYRLARPDLVGGLVYPVPDPAYPFLGVHFTRRVDGVVDVGPNAVLALAREGYRWRDVVPGDLIETLRYPGFRRLARRHWRMGARELRGSLLRTRLRGRGSPLRARAARLRPRAGAGAGVRAQAVDPDGSLVDDFRIGRVGPVTAVRNAPSPGATSCLAIAEYVTAHI